MRYLSWLAIVGLSALIVHLSNQNRRLVASVSALTAAAATSATACLLPPKMATTASNAAFVLEFPRTRALMLLASDRNCQYCESAIENWSSLLKDFPALEGALFDGRRSYPVAELARHGISPNRVLVSLPAVAPYKDLLSGTPALLLVGRNGRVLGIWKGPLSASAMQSIKLTVGALLL